MITHKCNKQCTQLQSEQWQFVLHEYEAEYQTLIEAAF